MISAPPRRTVDRRAHALVGTAPTDVARHRGVDWLADGEGISNDELDACAKAQGVDIRRADFVIIRTGQMERCLNEKEWGGYAGGDAPGVMFENCYWCQKKEIAAICSDTWKRSPTIGSDCSPGTWRAGHGRSCTPAAWMAVSHSGLLARTPKNARSYPP